MSLLRQYGSLIRRSAASATVESSDEEQDPAQVLPHSRLGNATVIVLTTSFI